MNVSDRLEEDERKAVQATTIDELEDLVDDAKSQGQLRAYACQPLEVLDEGTLAIDLMEEWGVPADTITNLRGSLGRKLRDKDNAIAHGALQKIFEESDSWSDYIDEYSRTMKRFARLLGVATLLLLPLAIVLLHIPSLVLVGILLAGAVGGCVSVIRKMPGGMATPSKELEAYERLILGRTITGAIASVVGCAFLAWGLLPLSIQNQTFWGRT